MGDSVNLMISKLVPYDNRLILITNGFMLLGKLWFYDDTPYTLDQLEHHNVRRVSSVLYRKTIMAGLDFVVMCQKLSSTLASITSISYRFWDEPKPTDHLVHYGFYTDDIARLMKINPRLSDFRSLRDLAMCFIFPNCAFKFRQSGSSQSWPSAQTAFRHTHPNF